MLSTNDRKGVTIWTHPRPYFLSHQYFQILLIRPRSPSFHTWTAPKPALQPDTFSTFQPAWSFTNVNMALRPLCFSFCLEQSTLLFLCSAATVVSVRPLNMACSLSASHSTHSLLNAHSSFRAQNKCHLRKTNSLVRFLCFIFSRKHMHFL